MNHALKTTLEEIYSQYHKPRYMRLDPVEYLRRFTGPGNMEIAGLLASSLAYGKVESIRGSIERVFSITGYDLIDFIRSTPLSGKKRLFRDFKHRFTSGDDIALLFECVGRALVEKDSLGALFSEGLDAGGRTIKQPLNEFSKRMRSWAQEISKGKIGSFSYLFPMPETGSACKRRHRSWYLEKRGDVEIGDPGGHACSRDCAPSFFNGQKNGGLAHGRGNYGIIENNKSIRSGKIRFFIVPVRNGSIQEKVKV